MLSGECTSGLFKGTTTRCETVNCYPQTFGDANGDGTVDMTDFGVLQSCLVPPPHSGPLPDACRCLDMDSNRVSDNSLNQLDVENFVQCANGPSVDGRIDGACLGFGW